MNTAPEPQAAPPPPPPPPPPSAPMWESVYGGHDGTTRLIRRIFHAYVVVVLIGAFTQPALLIYLLFEGLEGFFITFIMSLLPAALGVLVMTIIVKKYWAAVQRAHVLLVAFCGAAVGTVVPVVLTVLSFLPATLDTTHADILVIGLLGGGALAVTFTALPCALAAPAIRRILQKPAPPRRRPRLPRPLPAQHD